MKRNDKRRADWMAAFERNVVAARPDRSGHIDWDTATFFFNCGLTAAEASVRFVNRLDDAPDDGGMAEERRRHP